jgi:hypothetical protein
MDGKYSVRSFMAGGAMSLAGVLAEGTFSKLWQNGVRWLLCVQLTNLNGSVRCEVLRYLPNCTHDGIVEVVSRDELPDSKVRPLMIDKKTICVDERRLTKDQIASLGSDDGVCTGTFWIRCEKFAEVLGVARQDLEASWDSVAWKDKIDKIPLADHAILALSDDMLLAPTMPLWEVIRPLNLLFGKVGADRVPGAK